MGYEWAFFESARSQVSIGSDGNGEHRQDDEREQAHADGRQ